MIITLNLTPEDTEKLNDIAAKNGGDVEAAARLLFKEALADAAGTHDLALENQSTPVPEWNAEFRAKYNISPDMQPFVEKEPTLTPEEETEAINLGLDDSFAGRVTPLAEWSAKVRARHNLPEGVKAMTHEELMRLL